MPCAGKRVAQEPGPHNLLQILSVPFSSSNKGLKPIVHGSASSWFDQSTHQPVASFASSLEAVLAIIKFKTSLSKNVV